MQGAHTLYHIISQGRYEGQPTYQLVQHALKLGVTLHISNGATVVSTNIVKHNIFHRPDEAILFVMIKAGFLSNIILLFRTFANFVLHLYGFKHNKKPLFT